MPMTAFVRATVIDGHGGQPIEQGTVLVDGGRFLAVGPAASTPVPSTVQVDHRLPSTNPGEVAARIRIAGDRRRLCGQAFAKLVGGASPALGLKARSASESSHSSSVTCLARVSSCRAKSRGSGCSPASRQVSMIFLTLIVVR